MISRVLHRNTRPHHIIIERPFLCDVRHGGIIHIVLWHPVFVQRVRRQVNPVVPIDASAATIHLHLLPKMWHLFQQPKLLNLLHILPHIIHHRLPDIKHNRKTVIQQSFNALYSWQSIHYSNDGSR